MHHLIDLVTNQCSQISSNCQFANQCLAQRSWQNLRLFTERLMFPSIGSMLAKLKMFFQAMLQGGWSLET